MIVSDLLKDEDRVRHGFFTREGGVSSGIYGTLNCGSGSGDDPVNVQENRLRVATQLGVLADCLVTVRQVHGDHAHIADAPWPRDAAPEADAIVTTTRGLAIGVLTADCTPILFSDAEAGVVGAAHAGWKGARKGIIGATVAAMERLGARREAIRAVIGPTISLKAYEVGDDFYANFVRDNTENKSFFNAVKGGKPHFDLPAYCRKQLRDCGCDTIEDLKMCTYENESLFFSFRRATHRGEHDYGRQISAIVLL
jgi:YfiH family protein